VAPAPCGDRLAQGLGRLWSLGLQKRWPSVATIAAAVLLCVVGLPKLRWQDDPQKLTILDPQLEAEDLRVRKTALGQEGSEFVFLLSPSTEQDALGPNDELAAAMKALVAQGKLGGFSSVHNVVWSEALQLRNVNWVKEKLSLAAIHTALEKEDFESAAFAPFGDGEKDLSLPPLRLADLPRSVYDTFVAPWFISLPDGRKALLTRLTDVKDEVALRNGVSKIAGATYMNVSQFRSDAYALFRNRMLWLLGIGLVVVGTILWIHYRRLTLAVCAFGPAVLSAGCAVAALALLGQPLNLMHVMGLLLILSMGADYGIFLVESVLNKTPMGAPALSVVMACLSTVLSFGLLALSTSPALSAVGQTIGLGVVLAMVFSVAFATILLPQQTQVPA
jgi:predicted exporter